MLSGLEDVAGAGAVVVAEAAEVGACSPMAAAAVGTAMVVETLAQQGTTASGTFSREYQPPLMEAEATEEEEGTAEAAEGVVVAADNKNVIILVKVNAIYKVLSQEVHFSTFLYVFYRKNFNKSNRMRTING